MAGFFKKVAGAFVYLDEADANEPKLKTARGAGSLEDVARETNDLIAQLARTPVEAAPQPRTTTPAAAGSKPSSMSMTADEIFTAGGISDGANSAQRLLRIIAGLTMFPRDQQVVMVRAMDAADETWSEKAVLDDARRRQSALRTHLQAIDSERAEKIEAVRVRMEKAQADGKRRLDEIDRQISDLQKQHQEVAAATTSALNEFERDKKQTEEAAEKARRGMTTVINALSDLITFFTGGETKPAAKS